MCSYLALSQGLAFFHAGCRNRWALRLAKHSLRGTGKKMIYKCICIYALLATYCNVLQQDKRGCWQDHSVDRVLLSCLHTYPISQNCYGLKIQVLQWKTALTRSSIQGITFQFATFLLPQNTLHKQGDVYQNVSSGTCFKSRDLKSQNM